MRLDPFTNRIYWSRVLVVLLLAYVLASQPPKWLPTWLVDACETAGLLLLAGAAFGRIWCLVFIAGKKNNEIVTDGPYSVVRNPLYIFSFLGAVGFGLSVENPPLAVLLAIAFGAYYPIIVRREERYLTSTFGETYQKYAAITPRWIPRFDRYHQRDVVPVFTTKIRSGILDAMWFIWAFLIWELIENVRGAI